MDTTRVVYFHANDPEACGFLTFTDFTFPWDITATITPQRAHDQIHLSKTAKQHHPSCIPIISISLCILKQNSSACVANK